MPVSLWHAVDGVADNAMAVDVVDGVMEAVIVGACVRDAGWRASAEFQGARDQYGWPPQDHLLSVTLQRAHWEWVLGQLQRWAEYEEDDTKPTAVRAHINAALNDE